MRFVDIIEKKKNGCALTQEELHFFIDGYVHEKIPEYQVSALLMAIYFTGMNEQETAWLTEEMLYSGDVIDLSSVPGVKCDKHSTGGVGDKTSLSLAPMVAACGCVVAKMSGRGLGHTGGTLDKIESIDGFNVSLTKEAFLEQVSTIKLAIIGQSGDLVPADKKLYALRDVTATVNSIPLIASSIMSKKLAAGADTILLDVKFGEGAFMPTPDLAIELAKTMIRIGRHFGKDVRALISDMNQPLGNAIGNALEVKEAIATLQGKGPEDFQQLCYHAGAIMLQQAGIASDDRMAHAMLSEAIQTGTALTALVNMARAQGGNVQQILHPETLPQARYVIELTSTQEGYIQEAHAMKLGVLAMKLGAGRAVKDDVIDPAVGLVLQKKQGDRVMVGDVLAQVHCNHELSEDWIKEFYQAFHIEKKETKKNDLIYQVIHE